MVFDGANPSVNLHHPKNPKTEYGYQKARIEEELVQAGYDCAIVRLTKVAASNMPILNNWQKNLDEGKSIRPFSDYICSLVGMDQVTACLFHFARFKKRGLWHVSAPDEVSYAMLANRYLQFRGLPKSLAKPITAQEAGFNFYLPQYTTLDASLTEKEMNFTFAPSMDAFEKLLTHVVT
jgi:dTDP-4-dehydrorhamnose reductase